MKANSKKLLIRSSVEIHRVARGLKQLPRCATHGDRRLKRLKTRRTVLTDCLKHQKE